MKIEVRPARRDGVAKCIFDGALKEDQIIANASAVGIKICAKDIYTQGSQHSYLLTLHLDELAAMLKLLERRASPASGA